MSRRAIGYIRVSSVGGRSGPEYHTLQIQQASIERVAKFHQYDLVDVLTDEDQSGKTRNRPQFQIAMQRVLAGDADALIVWKVSRFSRNWREAAEDVETLLEANKDLLSEEGFDTKTTGGRLLLRILFSMANWEHEVLGEHWETIKAKAVRDRGSHLGQAPLGYRHSGVGGVLEVDPDTADVVVRLFERRAAGATWRELTDMLDTEVPRAGGGRRERKVVQSLIANRIYLGEVRWRDEVHPAAHPELVTMDLWDRANRIAVTADGPAQHRRERSREFPLTGWLRCSSCLGPMSGHSTQRGELRFPNYACSRRNGGCERPTTISALAAEAWAIEQAAEMHEALRVAGAPDDRPDLNAAVTELGEIERALHELASVQVRRELGADWRPMISKLRAEKVEVERKVARLRVTAGLPDRTVAWADLPDEDRWGALRRMAPAGAVVGPAIGRGRNARPADRLAFLVDDVEAGAVPDTEAP